jgi:hypothetical protein
MPFEFIQIPANGQGAAKEELNKLLRGGRIASVRKEFVANAEDSFRAFWIMLPSCPQLRPAVPESMAPSIRGLNRPPTCSAGEIPAHEPTAGAPGAGSAAEAVSKTPGAPISARPLPPSARPASERFPHAPRS